MNAKELLTELLLWTYPVRFEIISTKESGVIYGWQLEPNGVIKYGKTLPPDTQISRWGCVAHVYCSMWCMVIHIKVGLCCTCLL